MMRVNAAAVCVITGLLLLVGPQTAAGAGKSSLSPDDVLKQRVDRHKVKSSLAVALADFGVRTGIEVTVDWRELAAVGIERSHKVSVSVEKVTWRQVLDVILSRAYVRGAPLGWRVEDSGVFVTTQKKVLEATARTAKTVSEAKRAATKPKKKADNRAKLLSRIEFVDMPLEDVLRFFQNVLNANMHVNWKALAAAGIGKDTPVSLDLRHISAGRALDLALSEINADRDKYDRVYWMVDRGVLVISTGTSMDKTMVTRVIDAGTSLMVIPDVKGPRIEISQASQNTAGSNSGGGQENIWGEDPKDDSGEKSYAEQKKKQREAVIDSIKATIGSDMWKPDGKGTIQVHGNKLIITQSLLGFKLMEKSLR